MTRRERGSVDVSASGGATRLVGFTDDEHVAPPMPELTPLLDHLEAPDCAGPLVPAGDGPFFAPGQSVAWHFRDCTEVVRVVSDDERGLVCWLPGGSPRIEARFDGGSLRELDLAARFRAPRTLGLGTWRGPGILRAVPSGMPWSLWWFYDEDGTCLGVYVNVEVPHHRPAALAALPAGAAVPEELARVHTRDLILDLWLEDEEIWFKDEDELVAAQEAGRVSAEQARIIEMLAEIARVRLGQEKDWPMRAGFETFRPSPELAAPAELPDNPVVRAGLAQIDS